VETGVPGEKPLQAKVWIIVEDKNKSCFFNLDENWKESLR
jgi:hypothetical protein